MGFARLSEVSPPDPFENHNASESAVTATSGWGLISSRKPTTHLLLAFLTYSGHTMASAIPPWCPGFSGMFDLNTIVEKIDREALAQPRRRTPAHEDAKQRKLMVGSLCLLLLALSLIHI